MKKRLIMGMIIMMGVMLNGCGIKENYEEVKLVADQKKEITFHEVSVHDPSVIKHDGMYYIFGSHLSGAKSADLMNWEKIGNGVNKSNPIIVNPLEEMKEAFTWAKTDTFWAPDVIQLEDGKFYMYDCNCEGSSPLACLGIAVSDTIEGPYKDLGIILKSGMTDTPSENGDFYDATVYPNVVDPCVYYDASGRLWMMYGSYSGGIYVLELNTKTGFPLDKGYGKKILGGNHLRIEGSYVIYNTDTSYYYMFLSFGGLDADGGYNIRVCRSKTPDGPYYDFDGRDMIECTGAVGTFFDDEAAEKFGMKLMGGYRWSIREGEEGIDRKGLVSPGHNSAIYDEESDKYFLLFHTRFEKKGEMHQVQAKMAEHRSRHAAPAVRQAVADTGKGSQVYPLPAVPQVGQADGADGPDLLRGQLHSKIISHCVCSLLSLKPVSPWPPASCDRCGPPPTGALTAPPPPASLAAEAAPPETPPPPGTPRSAHREPA